jgi:thiol:disulfide interchange protein DsbA
VGACAAERPVRRRTFTRGATGALAAAATWGGGARAQSAPVEGVHYVRLRTPVATHAGAGQFELIDFFWYGCPHCNAFEPALLDYIRTLPADVVMHRVPVAFKAEPFVAHQKLYYALDSMGLVDSMHRRVFHAIHQERMLLDKEADIAAFVAREGIDAARFMEAYKSFGTQAKLRQADQLVDAYQIDGVPAIGVHGRYYTSGTLAGSNEQSLQVADWLLQGLRRQSAAGVAAHP